MNSKMLEVFFSTFFSLAWRIFIVVGIDTPAPLSTEPLLFAFKVMRVGFFRGTE